MNGIQSRREGYLPAALVLLSAGVAAALRFIGLASQGIGNYDEAAHLLEARFFRLAFLHHSLGRDVAIEGLPLFHAKPLHAFLIALVQAILGDHPWCGGVVSALFGTATVLLVYDLGRRFWGRIPGAVSAALYAALPWAVLYGRMALAEADSAFLVLLAVRVQAGGLARAGEDGGSDSSLGTGRRRPRVAWIRQLLRPAAVGGISSLAFLANYRWGALLILLFLGIELVRPLPARVGLRGSPPGASRLVFRFSLRFLAFAVGALIPVFLMDAGYGLMVLGPLLDQPLRPRSYFEDLSHNFGKFEAMGIGLRDPLRLPLFLWTFGRPFLILGLLVALVAGVRRGSAHGPSGGVPAVSDSPAQRARARFGLAVALLAGGLPVLLFLVTPCVFPRCLSAALAPWCLLSGWGFSRFLESRSARQESLLESGPELSHPRGAHERPQVAAFILGWILLLGQVVAGRAVWSQRSGYAEAAAWLKSRGADRCVSTQAYAMRVYGLRTLGLPPSLLDVDALHALVRSGYRYVLVDNQIWISGYADSYRALRESLHPVASLAHPAGGSASFVWEGPRETVAETLRRSRGQDWLDPSVILIYDLAQLSGPPEAGSPPSRR